ncbi:SpaA isopeptide-forming pilin-related protein [Varibaculum sp.]|uniref:MSCRAMM family protein n=3 Tax=Varibaculum sp. TaxID=1895474 RepID=UPI0025DC2970|nr:SpaA isopeptide-forming pilin-related protein [Varibaculum sp.]
MKRTGSNINGQNIDSNAADRTAQPNQLSGANHGNPDDTYSEPVKAPAFNRRTLGVASVLGLLFSSLLAVTLFFASADNSASQSPKFDAKTVSENTIFAFAQLKPAEFSTANSFYHSDLDPADVFSNQKSGGALAVSRNQRVAETSAAQSGSANSVRSQCSGAACTSPRRAPVAPTVKLKLFKLGVTDPKLVRNCLFARKVCSAGDGELVAGARFALYKGSSVDEAKKVGEYTVGEDGVEISGLQQGSYTLKEVEAPAGYELNPNNVSLNVKSDGRVERGRGKIFAYLENNEFYFPNLKAVEPEVSLFKLGVEDLAVCSWGSCSADNGELLDGAEFALYEGTGADTEHQVGKTFTVGKDGLKIPGLQVGKTYSLLEVRSPAGYEANGARYTFEVDADGKAKYQTDNGSQFFVDNKIFVPNKKAAPPTVTVRLFKLGVTDSKLVRNCLFARKVCSAGDGELVAGARFALYKGSRVDEANKVGEYTVGKDGVEISGLQQGSYTLKEVEAPAGYELNPNNVSLNVKSDGRVERGRGKIFAYLENNEFYFPNLKVQTIDISLNKVSDKDTPLENVKFDLYEADNPAKPVQNITTDEHGKATLTVTPGRKYRLVETATAPGYALLPQAIEFQVDANGTVTIDKQNGNVNTVTGGDKTLKVVNYPEGKLPLSGHAGSLQVLLIGLSLLLAAVTITLFERKRN